jgi:hypothetical protein
MNAAYTERSGLNRFWLGFLLGLGLPLVIFMLYFLFRFQGLTIGDYIQILIKSEKFVHVMSLSVFPNLLPFMFFVRTDRFKSGRGIMAITVVYAILIFALKFAL